MVIGGESFCYSCSKQTIRLIASNDSILAANNPAVPLIIQKIQSALHLTNLSFHDLHGVSSFSRFIVLLISTAALRSVDDVCC